jgi:hypothetical protein
VQNGETMTTAFDPLVQMAGMRPLQAYTGLGARKKRPTGEAWSKVKDCCFAIRPMQVTLTPHAEELLRDALARHPGQSPAQILEEVLAERVERQTVAEPGKPKRTPVEFDAWVREFSAYSDKIPSMPGETFSRAMIYEDRS